MDATPVDTLREHLMDMEPTTKSPKDQVAQALEELGWDTNVDEAVAAIEETGVERCAGCGYWVLYIVADGLCEPCYEGAYA